MVNKMLLREAVNKSTGADMFRFWYMAISGDETRWHYAMVVYRKYLIFGFIPYYKQIHTSPRSFPRRSYYSPRADGLVRYSQQWRDEWIRANGYAV